MTDMSVADDFDVYDDPSDDSGRGKGGGIFGVILDPYTYGSVIYMLLALPLGVAYFTFAVVGLSLSIGLMILIIGVVVALVFMALTRGLSIFEGYVTGILLGAQIERVESDVVEMTSDDDGDEDVTAHPSGLWTQIKRMFADVRTWTSMVYMALMLPLGTGYFTIAVTGFVTSLALMFAPVASIFVDDVHVMMIEDDSSEFLLGMQGLANSPLGMILMSVVGLVLFIAMLHVARGIGWFQARLAEKMLVKRS
jgi:hypothetical protein